MNENQITNKLSIIFTNIIGVIEFNNNLSMSNVQGWDSLKHIQLLSAIEENFNIEIPFEDAIEMISIPIIRQKIVKHLKFN